MSRGLGDVYKRQVLSTVDVPDDQIQSSVASLIPSPSESADTTMGIMDKTSRAITAITAPLEPMPFGLMTQ